MGEASAAGPQGPDRVSLSRQLAGYFASLWRGDLPLRRVFWIDTIVIGSAVNVVASALAMLIFVSGAPIIVGVIVHFAPVPYNVLLFLAVWQSAARENARWSFPAQGAAVVWLAVSIVL